MTTQTNAKEKDLNLKALGLRLGLSAGLAALLLAGLLCAGAALCLALDLPGEKLAMVAIPLAALAAAAAGYLHVRPVKKQGLLQGMLAAAALYVLTLGAALAVSRAMLGANAVILLLAMLLGGAAGGIFAVNHAGATQPTRHHKGTRRPRFSARFSEEKLGKRL